MPGRIFFVSLLGALLIATATLTLAAKPEPNARRPADKVIKIVPGDANSTERALQYSLLPDPLDMTAGNAALLWVQAFQYARDTQRVLDKDEFRWWINPKPGEQDNPSTKDLQSLLGHFAGALHVADLAARRTHCDWDHPPLTLQNFTQGLMPLGQIQGARELARLLDLQCQFELRNKHFDKAAHTLQTGLTLARHVGNGDTLIESIVGRAIAMIMFNRVEEWLGIPGSPDLYWSLSALPSPLVDLRRPVAYEFGTVYRSFPLLRRLNGPKGSARLSEAEARRLTDELFTELEKWGKYVNLSGPGVSKSAVTRLMQQSFPVAKTYLLAHGWTEADVKVLPAELAVVTFWMAQYDETCDNILKWMSVPPWQGSANLEKVVRAESALQTNDITAVLRMLFPALTKNYEAWLRGERQVAALRCMSAVRMYAASHSGKAPAKLSDITSVPLPIDPATGKGFDDGYSVKDGKAVLDVRGIILWRFEMPAEN